MVMERRRGAPVEPVGGFTFMNLPSFSQNSHFTFISRTVREFYMPRFSYAHPLQELLNLQLAGQNWF